MTDDMMKEIAMDILKKQEFTDGILLFDAEDIDEYRVTDGIGSMCLVEFLDKYTEVIIEIVKQLKGD